MNKTEVRECENKIAVNTEGLQAMLGCGKTTALIIGEEAHARIKVGRRVLWSVEKIQNYLNNKTE